MEPPDKCWATVLAMVGFSATHRICMMTGPEKPNGLHHGSASVVQQRERGKREKTRVRAKPVFLGALVPYFVSAWGNYVLHN